MNNRSCAAIVISVLFTGVSAAPATPPPGYELVWSDEFNGPGINENEWNYREGKALLSRCDRKWISIDGGAMKIELTKDGGNFSGGGLITKRMYKSGYFEVAAQMDGGPGWHEAFWTTWASSTTDLSARKHKDMPRVEIDCFEQYGALESNKFSYGTIQWHPIHGNIGRACYDSKHDLSAGFHVFGFESTADYVAYYFDGQMIAVDDLRGVEQNDFSIWLTCIATKPGATAKNGAMLFDYLRCYALDQAVYPARRDAILARLPAEQGFTTESKGFDVWIEAEDFADKKSWKTARDGAVIIAGLTKKKPKLSEDDRTACTTVHLANAGTYRLWVRARDFEKSAPGSRSFAVAVNKKRADTLFGTHKKDGYEWQDGGVFTLSAGPVTLDIIDTSQSYVRCDKLLLTTDLSFTPTGRGRPQNAVHRNGRQ